MFFITCIYLHVILFTRIVIDIILESVYVRRQINDLFIDNNFF